MRGVTLLLGLLLVDCATTQEPELHAPPSEPAAVPTSPQPAPEPAPAKVVRTPQQRPDGIAVQRPTPATKTELDCTMDASERRALYTSTIRRHMPGMEACYEAELRKDPNLRGKYIYKIGIAPAGDVARVQIVEDTLHNDETARCTVAKIQTWTFDPVCASEPLDVSFGVSFTGHTSQAN